MTTMELTIYLGQKIKEYADHGGRQLVVAWGSVCQGTRSDVDIYKVTKRY